MPDVFTGHNMMRKHNASVKNALRRCLIYHHEKTIKKHFRFGAHSKYNYGKRSEVTMRVKSKLGKRYLDLVMSGKSKRKFMSSSNRQIRVGGTTYGSGRVSARMTLKWPPGYYDRRDAKPQHITKAKMTREIETWTQAEERFIADLFGRYYAEEMRKRIREGGRVFKKYQGQLQAQGIF